MLKLIQPGHGPIRLVVLAYFTADTAALLKSLPSSACVMVDLDNANGRMARPPGKAGVETSGVAVARALREADFDSVLSILVIGWSAGCQAVREQLRAGAEVDAVLALDGCSGNVPPTADQLGPWKLVAARARASEACVVLTHTAMGYMEHLVPAKRYASTTHTIEAITGTTGAAIQPAGQDITPVDGELYVLAYPSADIDGPAHLHQQNVAMPDILARIIVPWLLARAPGASDPTAPAPRPAILPPPISLAGGNVLPAPGAPRAPRTLRRGMHGDDVRELQTHLNKLGAKLHVDGDFGGLTEHALRSFQVLHHVGADGALDKSTRTALAIELANLDARGNAPTEPPSDDRVTDVGEGIPVAALSSPTPFRLRCLARAIAELGVHETPGPGTTPRVAEYLGGCVRGDRLLKLAGDEPAWCCAFAGWTKSHEALPGDDVAPWRAAVSEAWADAVKAGKAHPKDWTPRAGDLAVFGRVVNGKLRDPRVGGAGHIAFVELAPSAAGNFGIVGGNQGGPAEHGGAVTRETRWTQARELVGWIEIG